MLTATWNQPPALRQGAMAIRFVVRAAPSSLLSQERLTTAVALPSPVGSLLAIGSLYCNRELGRLGGHTRVRGAHSVRTVVPSPGRAALRFWRVRRAGGR